MARIPVYIGDRLPTQTATITKDDGSPEDLTGATIEFAAWGEYETAKLFKAAAALNGTAVSGQVRYDPGVNDVPSNASPGVYDVFWLITISGKVMTVPAGQWELKKART